MFLEDKDIKGCEWTKDFPLITCGTGCGKTHFVVNGKLKKRIERDAESAINFTLLLVPFQILKNDILSTYPQTTVALDYADLLTENYDSRVRVACFAQIVKFLTDGNEILNFPDLIVFDEIDILVHYSLHFRGYIETWDYLLTNRQNKCYVGLTGTPLLLLDYIKDIAFVDITPNYPIKYKVDEIEVIAHSTLSTYMKGMKNACKALAYVRSAKECKRLSDAYENTAFIISKYNDKVDTDSGKTYSKLCEEQIINDAAFGERFITLREYLIKYNQYPPQVKTLIINDSMSAGFNLNDSEVDLVIADTVDLSIAIQVLGRVRHDIKKFVLIYNNRDRLPYFKNLERAKEFFEEDNPSQDYLKAWYMQESDMDDTDVLTFKSDGIYRINFFAKAIYNYNFDIYWRIENNLQGYLEPLYRRSKKVRLISGKKFAAEVRNQSKFTEIDLNGIFAFEDNETSKFMTAKELTDIAKSVRLKDAKGKTLGKDTFIKMVNEETDFKIEKIGQKQIHGKRATFYKVIASARNGG